MFLTTAGQLLFKPQSIISLVPSQTELLYHLGVGDTVKGITKFCIHPGGWKTTKTIVGGTKNINISLIQNLQPDLIIANREENVREDIALLANHFNVWLTDVTCLQDAIKMIKDIGMLTQTEPAALLMIKQIEYNYSLIVPGKKKLKVCYLIWQDPFMTVGGDTFIHDMLNKCGFQNLYAGKERYPVINLDELSGNGCDLLLLSTEPYPFKEKNVIELQQYLPHTKIMLVDGEMFSWYGSRLLQSAAYFSELINSVSQLI